MAIISLSAEQIATMNIGANPSRSKYPWYTTEVGGGFFIPRTDLAREDYRPAVPAPLKRKGQKWTGSKVTLPETNQVGVVMIRIV